MKVSTERAARRRTSLTQPSTTPGPLAPGLFFCSIHMNADLEQLIALQRLDSAAPTPPNAGSPRARAREGARRAARRRARAVAAAKERAGRQPERPARHRERGRASTRAGSRSSARQAMAVKTNQEYHAVQKEIAFAQTEIKTLEDKDPRADARSRRADGRGQDGGSRARRRAEDGGRRPQGDWPREHAELQASLERIAGERETLVGGARPAGARASSSGRAAAERRRRRRGARRHLHDLPRPAAAAGVQHRAAATTQIMQCDSCNRILYFVPAPASAAPRRTDRRDAT